MVDFDGLDEDSYVVVPLPQHCQVDANTKND